MSMQIEDFISRENVLLQEIDRAIERSGHMMNMEDASENEYEDLYEARYHCGVCTVREVMEEVWPSIDTYIKFLKEQTPDSSAQAVAEAALEFFTNPSETAFSRVSSALDAFAKGQ